VRARQVTSYQIIHKHRRNDAAEPQPKYAIPSLDRAVRETIAPPAPALRSALQIHSRALQHTQRFVLPQLRHSRISQQGSATSATPARITHFAPTRSITAPATSRRQSDDQETRKKPCVTCARVNPALPQTTRKNREPVEIIPMTKKKFRNATTRSTNRKRFSPTRSLS